MLLGTKLDSYQKLIGYFARVRNFIAKTLVIPTLITLALLPVTSIYSNGVVLFGDTDLTYHFAKSFFAWDKIYIWNDYFQSGSVDYGKFQAFFFKKFIYLLNILVGNLNLFSYLWYFLSYFFFVFSLFILLQKVMSLANDKLKPSTVAISSLVLSLLGFFNGITVLYGGQVLFIQSLSMVNVFLYLAILNLQSINKNNENNFILLFLMSFVLSEASTYFQLIILLAYAVGVSLILRLSFVLKHLRAFLIMFLVIGVSYLLLNLSWLIPMFQALAGRKLYEIGHYDVDLGWSFAVSVSKNIFLNELLRMKSYHVFNNLPKIAYFTHLIPLGLILWHSSVQKKVNNSSLIFSLKLLLIIFLVLSFGVHPITTKVYTFLWKYLPSFDTFRTIMKFSFVYLYAIIFTLSLILANAKNGARKISLILLVISLITGYSFYFQKEFSRNLTQYKIPEFYTELQNRNFSANSKLIGNTILMPQLNWQFQYNWAPMFVDSMNVFPYFYGNGVLINGAQYTPDPQFEFNRLFYRQYRTKDPALLNEMLLTRNIKYLVYQKDTRFPIKATYVPGSHDEDLIDYNLSQDEVENMFDSDLCQKTFSIGDLSFCEVLNSIFTPVIYPSKSLTATEQNDLEVLPKIEFKKINSTKYRAIVHGATQNFKLNLLQNHNDGWQIFIVPFSEGSIDQADLNELRLFGDYQEKHASNQEILDFIGSGLVTSVKPGLNDDNKIGYISKLFQGSVQNDNLSDSSIFETWFIRPLEIENKLINDYGNSWEIEPKILCQDNTLCEFNNVNNSYDFEFVIEFSQQKFVYIGLIISALTVLTLIVLMFIIIIKQKQKK